MRAFLKSTFVSFTVIPAKAGIHKCKYVSSADFFGDNSPL
jgi:hypothetical protein